MIYLLLGKYKVIHIYSNTVLQHNLCHKMTDKMSFYHKASYRNGCKICISSSGDATKPGIKMTFNQFFIEYLRYYSK